MAQLNLGKVKFVWRGVYNPATVYQRDDVVSYLGSAWMCKAPDTINVAPAEPSANWDVMARGIVATAFTQALLTAPTAAAARAVLELGTAAVADIGTAAGDVLGVNSTTPFTLGFLQALNAGEGRTALGAQQADTTLSALAAINFSADKLLYSTGADAFALTDLTAFARSLLDDASAAAARSTLGAMADADAGFAFIYPNGGTSGAPANVAINTRYVESNPFPGHYVLCEAEILFSGEWVTTGWYATSGSSAIGVKASQLDGGSIIVRTGVSGLIVGGQISGSNANYTATSTYSTPTPCRVKVWKIKGATA